MARIITTDFGAIHDALNRLIIGEVKEALRLVPEQMYQGTNLCRIVVSGNTDYAPKDVAVDCVWLDNNNLCFSGHLPLPDYADDNDEAEQYEGGEEDGTDWLNITDFHYLIEQLKDLMPENEDCHVLANAIDQSVLDVAISNARLCY